MKKILYPFQKKAVDSLLNFSSFSSRSFKETAVPQIVSLTAPTGSGKTIIASAFIEATLCGIETIPGRPEAVFLWISDSPELNEQSRMKMEAYCDRLYVNQYVTIEDSSFNQEMLDDGTIYFLNTQKLSTSSNLTKHSDSRQYTIWETLKNTAQEKADRFYVLIDEAHRGAQGNEAGKQQTIMAKFIMGSESDGIDSMPVVIGMSATIERFNKLIGNTTSTLHKIRVSADEVRGSGLLKEKIIVRYPDKDAANNEMAVLQAATDEWLDKCAHWHQFCEEQHYAFFNPIFVIQVLNGVGNQLSATDLDECLAKIEAKSGIRFTPGEVVHTFGQTNQTLKINGLDVWYCEPSRISEEKRIRIVFFKENLSTGWDCPRAETMMSFRRATDSTYIAQLLGRMIRTPRGQKIKADESLNDVHLFLPNFNRENVSAVINALKSSEGGDIPADIETAGTGTGSVTSLTVRPMQQPSAATSGGSVPMPIPAAVPGPSIPEASSRREDTPASSPVPTDSRPIETPVPGGVRPSIETIPAATQPIPAKPSEHAPDGGIPAPIPAPIPIPMPQPLPEPTFDRLAVLKAINKMGLLTYRVRDVRTSNSSIKSLFLLTRVLKDSGLYSKAVEDIKKEIAAKINSFIKKLFDEGSYEERKTKLLQFGLIEKAYTPFGEVLSSDQETTIFSSTDTDIDRQLKISDAKLGNENIANTYCNHFYREDDDTNWYKIDVILFANDLNTMASLQTFAETKFKNLQNEFRRKIAQHGDEKITERYDKIVSDGSEISSHSLQLPETLDKFTVDSDGDLYYDHLHISSDTMAAQIKLNNWEKSTLEEERRRPDYICWFRNEPRKSWSLCIPYEMEGKTSSTYPDMLIIRKEGLNDYVVDVLEPHDSSRKDNLPKAKGFAKYAKSNPGLGRIELIRLGTNPAGQKQLVRLDMADANIQDDVLEARSNEDLDRLFDLKGKYQNY